MYQLLIVDDNDEIRSQLKWGLGKDYSLLQAADCAEAVTLFAAHSPQVVTLDLGLPPDGEGTTEGFACLEAILAINPSAKVIVLTGNNDRDNAYRAIAMGAYDFYQKPVNLTELKVIISRAYNLSSIEQENRRLQAALDDKVSTYSGIIGQCPEMQQVFAIIQKVAVSDISVLITGESGTGKELIARAIHAASLKKDGPFITINCGAIPENLLESELFGHEKGAFTGAHTRVQGKVEYAHNGTLFLDEIGELPAQLQVKLLRFLQERSIQRVGGREDIHVETRIVAATNIDIMRAIKTGAFREDLYYRLGVITIALPPLRERGEDKILLANYFMRLCGDELKRKNCRFSPNALAMLNSYEWPGNVRELENKVQRAVLMSDSSLIEPEALGFVESIPSAGRWENNGELTLREARDIMEQQMIGEAVQKNHGNIAKAADALGISRPTLYDLMKKHGISS